LDTRAFETIARFEDLSQDTPVAAKACGVHLVVLRVGSAAHVFDGLCPHAGTPLVSAVVRGKTLSCAAHGWCFDAQTGRRVDQGEADPGACLHRFSATVVEGDVLVDADEVRQWASQNKPASPLVSF